MSTFLKFIDIALNPLANALVTITPFNAPIVSASYLAISDSIKETTDSNGYITASLIAANYKIQIADSILYGSVNTSSVFTPISASFLTGSSVNVEFDLIDILGDKFAANKITISPVTSNPSMFSSSVVCLNSTSSLTNNSGSVIFNLVPDIFKVECSSDTATTTFFISVPSSGSVNAKDILVVRPTKGIPIQLNNLDRSFVLTVSSSDARYAKIGAGGFIITGSTLPITSSWSNKTISASYAVSSSNVDVVKSLGYRPVSSNGDSIDGDLRINGNMVINSGFTMFDDTGFVPFNYWSNEAPSTYLELGDTSGNSFGTKLQLLDVSQTANFYLYKQVIAASASVTALSFSGSLMGTASNSISASYAPFSQTVQVSASFASRSLSSSIAITALTASSLSFTPIGSVSSSYANTASYAMNAGGQSPSSSWASSSISASYSLTSSHTDVIASLGYVPLNKSGDEVEGDLGITGKLLINSGFTMVDDNGFVPFDLFSNNVGSSSLDLGDTDETGFGTTLSLIDYTRTADFIGYTTISAPSASIFARSITGSLSGSATKAISASYSNVNASLGYVAMNQATDTCQGDFGINGNLRINSGFQIQDGNGFVPFNFFSDDSGPTSLDLGDTTGNSFGTKLSLIDYSKTANFTLYQHINAVSASVNALSFTGSLSGTASNAVTASSAVTSSYTNIANLLGFRPMGIIVSNVTASSNVGSTSTLASDILSGLFLKNGDMVEVTYFGNINDADSFRLEIDINGNSVLNSGGDFEGGDGSGAAFQTFVNLTRDTSGSMQCNAYSFTNGYNFFNDYAAGNYNGQPLSVYSSRLTGINYTHPITCSFLCTNAVSDGIVTKNSHYIKTMPVL